MAIHWKRVATVLMVASLTLGISAAAHADESTSDGAEPRVMVHLDSDAPVSLEQTFDNGDWRGSAWHVACSAPCDVQLPLGPTYRVGGLGTRRSKPFGLSPDEQGRVWLDVRRASKSAFAGGIALATLGPLALLIGGVVTLLGIAESSSAPVCYGAGWCETSENGPPLIATGLAVMSLGVGATVFGAVLLAANIHTTVVPRPGVDARRPVWNVERAPAPVGAWSAPIFSTTF